MRLHEKRCYICGVLMPSLSVPLDAVCGPVLITQVSRKCRNGHLQTNGFEK